jgi:N-acetylmuramate 1-kinase
MILSSHKNMPQATDALLRSVQQRFEGGIPSGLGAADGFLWEPIYQGGSDRDFHRVRCEGHSWIVMRYSTQREENLLYADIAAFLGQITIRSPRIHHHDAVSRIIVMEDLGDRSLHAIFHDSGGSPGTTFFYYQKSLSEVIKLHAHSDSPVKTMPGFDGALYRWERGYFLEHLVEGWAQIELSEAARSTLEVEGEQMAKLLTVEPRRLIHRDFQSQNILIREEEAYLIDFQGMRPGHAAYDVASLLYDPYVKLSREQRQTLLDYYIQESGQEASHFRRIYYRAVIQRLMQALGAYGCLGLVRGKPAFLKHIPQGLENLEEALGMLEEMPETLALVSDQLRPLARSTPMQPGHP